MKFSNYNIFFEHKDKYIGYNTLYNTTMLLDRELYLLIMKSESDPAIIKKTYERLYNIMVCNKFLVSNKCCEIKEIENLIQDSTNDSTRYEIVINPTINCNFRCWYCYQDHNDKVSISENDIIPIIKLIEETIKHNHNLKTIDIAWFGGEPLLHYHDVIKPILEKVKAITISNNIEFNSNMTTNGYLITGEILSFLKAHNHRTFQITLDGNKEKHNKIRFSKCDRDTYDKIIENIKSCIKEQFYVSVRLNIASSTNLNVNELLRDFEDVSESEKEFLCFSIHKVWQEPIEVEDTVNEIRDEIESNGFNASTFFDSPNTIRKMCYADKVNHVTINPRGLIYKCTARDFKEDNIEGHLLKNGTIKWTQTHINRQESSALNRDSCRKCQILPICNGGCSQKRLEHANDQCIYNFDSKSKLEYAKKIVYRKLLNAQK